MDKTLYKILGIIGIIILIVIATNVIFCANGMYNICCLWDIATENGRFVWNSMFKIVGAIFVFWGLVINAKRLNEVAKTNTQSEKGHNVTRFNSALEHLSEKNLVIALGGVFELEELAQIDEKYKSISLKLLHSRLRVISDEIKEVLKEIEFAKDAKPELKKAIQKEGSNKISALYELRDKILTSLIENGEKVFSNKIHIFENVDFTHYIFKSEGHSFRFKKCTFKFNHFEGEFDKLKFESCQFDKSMFFKETLNMHFKDCSFNLVDVYYVNFNKTIFKGENFFVAINLICCKNINEIDFSNITCYEDSFVQEKLDSIDEQGNETLASKYELFEYLKNQKD